MDYFISDLHFGHKNIIEYEKRPFRSVEHMNDELVKNWNKVVTGNDTVFCLGDVSFCGAELTRNYVSALNGKKILVMGNHDRIRKPDWWAEKGFQEVYRFPIIYKDWIVLGHEPPVYMCDSSPYYFMYGHVHGSEMYKTITRRSACVCVERWNYTPVSFERIKGLWNTME